MSLGKKKSVAATHEYRTAIISFCLDYTSLFSLFSFDVHESYHIWCSTHDSSFPWSHNNVISFTSERCLSKRKNNNNNKSGTLPIWTYHSTNLGGWAHRKQTSVDKLNSSPSPDVLPVLSAHCQLKHPIFLLYLSLPSVLSVSSAHCQLKYLIYLHLSLLPVLLSIASCSCHRTSLSVYRGPSRKFSLLTNASPACLPLSWPRFCLCMLVWCCGKVVWVWVWVCRVCVCMNVTCIIIICYHPLSVCILYYFSMCTCLLCFV